MKEYSKANGGRPPVGKAVKEEDGVQRIFFGLKSMAETKCTPIFRTAGLSGEWSTVSFMQA